MNQSSAPQSAMGLILPVYQLRSKGGESPEWEVPERRRDERAAEALLTLCCEMGTRMIKEFGLPSGGWKSTPGGISRHRKKP